MKIFGFFIIVLGLVVGWIGITGTQHNIANIIKGVHLPSSGNSSTSSKGGGTSAQNKTSSSSLASP